MSSHYDHLLEQAKEGKRIPDKAVRSIRQQLSTGRFETDPYTLIHILGKAGDKESLPIIKGYVHFDTGDAESDDMIRRIALQVIGRMWALPEALDLAISRAFNDPSKYVRATAAKIVGFLGSRYPQLKSRSAAALLEGVEKRNELDGYTWESFYEGVLELLEVPVSDWPSRLTPIKEADVRRDLIDQTRRIAEKR
jgi:HEAT repeat protein